MTDCSVIVGDCRDVLRRMPAESTNRNAVLIEINESYAQMAVDRINAASVKEAAE